jgi:RND superfamily putative drug exporter
MSPIREETAICGLHAGITTATARTGTVITSAGIILAGTFAALTVSPLQILLQIGITVAMGVLIDTFVVRSLLIPALTAFIGERAWWPSHLSRRQAGHTADASPAA